MLAGVTPGPSVSLVRAPPPSMRNLSGTSGLARTKENFPALGGAAGGSIPTTRVGQTAPVSAAFKKPANAGSASAGGAVARGNAPANGMLLHVSNRPSGNAMGKKAAPEMDFPALPTGKGKKVARNLDEDMLPSTSGVSMSNVAAKHRTLVDDYVSVAHPSTYHKLQMVQKEESEAKARLEAQKKSAPKLTAIEFPTLGPSSTKAAPLSKANGGSAASLNWSKPVSEKKQRELENRKAKVAPAPLLPTPKEKNLNNNNNNRNIANQNQQQHQQQQQQQQANKKDKKSKDKKNNQENQPKANKQKEKNNNNNNEKQLPIHDNNFNDNVPTTLRAPPGLSSNGASAVKPPPGFMSNVTVNSVAKLPNNLTFTSSLGENYSIVPSPPTYCDPPDTANRNQVGIFIVFKIRI